MTLVGGGFKNPIVHGSNILPGTVSSTELADGAVIEAKLADLAVAAGKLQDEAVTTAKLGDEAVTTVKLDDLAVTTAKIGLLAVGAAQIANASITNAQISSLNADKITAGIITGLRYRTAASGERLEIRGDTGEAFLRMYDTSGTLAGYMGYEPSGYGSNTMILSNELNLGDIELNADGSIELIADGSAAIGVYVRSDANGGIPGFPFLVGDSSGSPNYFSVTNSQGLMVYGQDPYTAGQAWLTLDSVSSGGSYDDQAAGISIGESGYLGSAAGHIIYTGDGYLHIGGGTVTIGNNPPMLYPAFKIHYSGNRVQHMSGAEAPGWDRYSNATPGSVRLDSSGTNYRVYQHTSSARFKSNLKAIPAKWAWDFIDVLEPLTYMGLTTKDYYAGLTAENVYKAEMLLKKRMKAKFVAMDETGEPDSYGDEGLTAVLIRAIQDLKKDVEQLKAA